MSNKTTMILTFIVTVVVPFIQEVVDLIEALKGRASSTTATAKSCFGLSGRFGKCY